jgi:hypothetical protein
LRCAVFILAVFRTWLKVRVRTGRDPATLLWVILSVLFPSVFTMVRVVPVADLVVVLVIEPAGFVTVCVIGVPVIADGGPIARPIGIGAPPPLLRCAAKGIQTSKPIAATERIRLRIEASFR